MVQETGVRHAKGFSLIELLVVIGIILIIAAIAIPTLLRSRIATNEASAVSSLRTINTAQFTYASTYSTIGYASSLAMLGGSGVSSSSTNALLIDNVLGAQSPGGASSSQANTKSGYKFYISNTQTTSGQVTSFQVNGDPITPGTTGVRYFYVDPTNVVHYNVSAIATSTDNPLQ